ncbi:MAG: winged helix-turn-helix transcriptional regulator [Rhizobiales bacterium]|nr:winged helix-turn-helix transcriptional regulator [Hyphomicrobiales bacterium]
MNVKRPQSKPPLIELEQFLPYRLNVVAEAVSRSLSRLYEERHGISIAEWRVIATLGQYPQMTAKQIGAHSRMHKTKVSRAVARLTDRNLIERAANSQDLREAFLALTPGGRKVYEDLVPRALAFADDLGESFTEQERAVLDKLLTKLEFQALDGGKQTDR